MLYPRHGPELTLVPHWFGGFELLVTADVASHMVLRGSVVLGCYNIYPGSLGVQRLF